MKNRKQKKQKLTKSVIADALSADGEYTIWDTSISGYGLRVRPSGTKSFVFVTRTPGGRDGKVRKHTIGSADKMNAETARTKAKELAGRYHGGADPHAEAREKIDREKNTRTVADVLDRFITDHAKENLKEKTAGEYERLCEMVLKPKLGKHKIDALAPKHVAEMYHEMRSKTPTQAALAVRVLSSAMSCAIEWGVRAEGSNPAKIRLKGTRRRERLFSDAEVARLQKATDELESVGKIVPSVARAIRLLFATGCRAGEICGLTWQGVDLEERLLVWPDTKTGYVEKSITVEAARLLNEAERTVGLDWVCPSVTGKRLRVETLEAGFERVMRAADVEAKENATLHLIRHWFSTKIYSDATIALPLQMKIVGHKSVATAMRYAHASREDVRKAAERAEIKRTAAVEAAGKKGQVVLLARQ